jgi:hypothetical protein
MAVNVNEKTGKPSPARRKKVEARWVELVAEEMTLRELRKARKLTQVRMAKSSASARTASRALRSAAISCFRRFQDGRGYGRQPVARGGIPRLPPVVLAGIAEGEPPNKLGRKHRHPHA